MTDVTKSVLANCRGKHYNRGKEGFGIRKKGGEEMEILDIPGLSMGLAQANASNAIGTAMLAKSLDMMETVGAGVVELIDRSAMEHSVSPNLGGNIDMMV